MTADPGPVAFPPPVALPPDPSAPRITLKGFVGFGGLEVRHPKVKKNRG